MVRWYTVLIYCLMMGVAVYGLYAVSKSLHSPLTFFFSILFDLICCFATGVVIYKLYQKFKEVIE